MHSSLSWCVESNHGVQKSQFFFYTKPLIRAPENPNFWQWHNHIWLTKTQLNILVSIETSWQTIIYKEKCMRMLKSCYAISICSWYGLGSRYQFKACELLFLIGKDSGRSQDAIETKIQAWIALEPWIQYWLFCEILQVLNACLCAAFQSWIIRVVILSIYRDY